MQQDPEQDILSQNDQTFYMQIDKKNVCVREKMLDIYLAGH